MSAPAVIELPAMVVAGRTKHLIAGVHVESSSAATFPSINPANGATLAQVAQGGAADIERAVAAARMAFEGPWRLMKASERQLLLLRLADLVEAHGEELAILDSLNMGGPLHKMRMGTENAAGLLRWYSAQARSIRGETIENQRSDQFFTYTKREPIGVVGYITPWNGPRSVSVQGIGMAIATGCTLVHKPAEQSPFSALRIAELALEAGVPEGVINVVTGDGEAGAALSAHRDVNKVIFTGSVETGQKIIAASAGNVKRLALELGGKSPDIVFEDADLDAAVPGAASGIFANCGQSCFAGSRLFVHRSIHDEFVDRLVEHARAMRVGDPLDETTDLGPLVSAEQLERVLGYVESGRAEGAVAACGARRLTENGLAAGNYLGPTIFTGVGDEMRIAREEIFGPVLSVFAFDSEDEVVARANATEYGLAAGVWTRRVARAHRMADRLHAGVVWVNTYARFDPAVPFGGYGMSGYGRKFGVHQVEEYLGEKTVWMNVA